MKKINVGQTIQVFANLGVIAGIVFLVIELHQNNTLLEAQASQQFLNNRISMTTFPITADGLAEAFVKGRAGEELTAVETFKLQSYYQAQTIAWEWDFQRYREGLIPESQLPVSGWKELANTQPGFRTIWDATASRRDPDFVSFVDSNVFNH